MRRLDPAAARDLLHGGGEVAFLDVREAGQFGEGHPLFAVPLPYSRLEERAPGLVPRRDAPVLLVDDGDGVAERAARRLESLGYTDVSIVDGGAPGWAAAGFTLYKGVNVPSKTLGELAEAVWHPKTITAGELASWKAEGRRFGVFDARPPSEYAKMRVPGAVCLPNGELAHRLGAVGEETIVVTCAGRTRGITGVIGLAVAGIDRPVYALENGTQGWALAGFDLERGNRPAPYPALSGEAFDAARRRADDLMRRRGIPEAESDEVRAFLADPGRTTFLLDVRSAEEARDDRVAAAVHAPSGQVVQATDQWVGVRRARLVLLDDSGLRAAIAAFWLRQLGFEAVVARIDDRIRALPARPAPILPPPPRGLSGEMAAASVRAGARLLDLRGSMDFRAGRAEGSVWSIRPRLAGIGAGGVVLVGDEAAAALAALDLAEAGVDVVGRVEGGVEALAAAGLPVGPSPGAPSDAEAIDHLFFVHDRHDGNLEASRRYLAWETGLVAQLDPHERAEFDLAMP